MSKFQGGNVPYPDYDAADTDNFNRKVDLLMMYSSMVNLC